MSSVPTRSDLPEEYTWELEAIFASDEEWEAAYEEAEDRLDDLRAYEGQVAESAETLLSVLETREAVMRAVANVSAYAQMRRDEDTRDQTYQALAARAGSLASDASSAASFIEPELQALDREALEKFAEEESALEPYGHYFDEVLRMKPYTRSAEIEQLLSELGEVTGGTGEVYNQIGRAHV